MEPTQADIESIRAVIPDDAAVFGPLENEYMFTDAQIGHYYRIADGNILKASAIAVYALAASEALISKVIKTQDLATDGAKVAEALIKKADALIVMAANADSEAIDGYFEIIDFGWPQGGPELTEGPFKW